MAYKPVVDARIEQLLTSWRADQPAFFWAPTRSEYLFKEQIKSVTGTPIDGALVGYGGIENPQGNGTRHLLFDTVLGLTTNTPFFAMLLVDIIDPNQVTGCFLKIGAGANGVGVGGGNGTFDDTGSKLIVLKENVAWVLGPSNAFVPGLNVINFSFTNQNNFGAVNLTTSIGPDSGVGGAYADPTGGIGINGYDNRGSNVTVCAVAIWTNSYDNIENVYKRQKLGAPFTGLARQYHKPWFTPRQIPEPIAAASGTVALTGNSATSAVGTLSPSIALAITGNAATSARGSFTLTESKAITGNQVTASRGTPVASISVALTGNQATTSQGTVTPAGTFSAALTGNQVTASRGTPVASISLAITGNQAAASAGVVTPPGNISTALIGRSATTSVGVVVPGISKAITGNAATSAVGTVTPASGNVVALTGNGAVSAVGMFTHGISLALTGRAATASIGALGVGGWQQIDDSQTPNWVQIADAQTPNWTPI